MMSLLAPVRGLMRPQLPIAEYWKRLQGLAPAQRYPSHAVTVPVHAKPLTDKSIRVNEPYCVGDLVMRGASLVWAGRRLSPEAAPNIALAPATP